MNPVRRVYRELNMAATRTSRRNARRQSRRTTARKTAGRRTQKAAPKRAAKAAAKPAVKVSSRFAPAPQVLFRLCRSGWAVIVETIQNAQGTRFVCPFCPVSHRVPGPVRGFRKMRRAQWVKLRKVEE
jgi:hypothetical protein